MRMKIAAIALALMPWSALTAPAVTGPSLLPNRYFGGIVNNTSTTLTWWLGSDGTIIYLGGMNVVPDADGTRDLGDTTHSWDDVWTEQLRLNTMEDPDDTQITTLDTIIPTSTSTLDLGSGTLEFREAWAQTVDTSVVRDDDDDLVVVTDNLYVTDPTTAGSTTPVATDQFTVVRTATGNTAARGWVASVIHTLTGVTLNSSNQTQGGSSAYALRANSGSTVLDDLVAGRFDLDIGSNVSPGGVNFTNSIGYAVFASITDATGNFSSFGTRPDLVAGYFSTALSAGRVVGVLGATIDGDTFFNSVLPAGEWSVAGDGAAYFAGNVYADDVLVSFIDQITSDSGVLSVTSEGQDISVLGGGINQTSVSGNTLTITGTEVDGSTSNETPLLDVNAETILNVAARTLGLDTQVANRVWAGPTTGAAAVPTFRAMVAADLPAGVGSVTSVGLALPTSVFDISGSPVTTSGTLTGTFDDQIANTVFAGPLTGVDDTPAFRAVVDNDIPNTITLTNLTQITTRDHGDLSGLSDDDHPQYGALAQAETIAANWVNTANPWAANELVSTVVIDSEVPGLEADTLATVTGRGATTTTAVVIDNSLRLGGATNDGVLDIQDGGSISFAFFDSNTGEAIISGLLDVTGNVTLGNADTDSHTITGNLSILDGLVRLDDGTPGSNLSATNDGDLYVEDVIEATGNLLVGTDIVAFSGTGSGHFSDDLYAGDVFQSLGNAAIGNADTDSHVFTGNVSIDDGLFRNDDGTDGTNGTATDDGDGYFEDALENDGAATFGADSFTVAGGGTGTTEAQGIFRVDNGTNGTPTITLGAGDAYFEDSLENDGAFNFGAGRLVSAAAANEVTITTGGYPTLNLDGTTGGQLAFKQSGTFRHSIYLESTSLRFYGSADYTTIDSSGNWVFVQNASVQGNTTLGNATTDTTTINGDVTLAGVGDGLKIKEGTNGTMGTATLVAGTVTVSNTAVTANTRIFLTGQNTSGTAAELTISARVANTSFTITSTSALDTRAVGWLLLEPG